MGYFPIHSLYLSYRTHVQGLDPLSACPEHREKALCKKVKIYYPLPGSPSGRPLIEAPNRAVLANSWNGYEGNLII
jgi:hypothetical protein